VARDAYADACRRVGDPHEGIVAIESAAPTNGPSGWVVSMIRWGYTLSSEEFGPRALVEQAAAGERAGFDFLTVSDHFHPWTQTQGESPFVWTTLGGVAVQTDHVAVGTGVTCPTMRYHPTIVAQGAATTAALFGRKRFFLGVGTGEALNEHIIGAGWPPFEIRRRMLLEAVAIMRSLWTGDTVNFEGEFYTVENARLFTVPKEKIPVIWAASGEKSAETAGGVADGLWSTSPNADVVDAYRDAGGTGPIYGQISLCYDEDEERARKTAYRVWPNACSPGQLSQDLPTWHHFESLAELVNADDVAEQIVCGPDTSRIKEAVDEYVEAGFDHIHFHQIGPDQDGFLELWTSRLRDELT
jgi:coenzyme F420-dependent glucose-6-phosphate dehydrogenase